MANDDDKPPDDIEERWKPPTDWTDAKAVRDWLELVVKANSTTADMLESVVPMLRAGLKAVEDAMPSLPDEAKGLPEEPKATDRKLLELLLDPTRGGQDRWKPNWADVHDVRSWLTLRAQSFENMANVMEGLDIMLRGMGQTLRKARPPLPVVVEDTPPPVEPKE